jgi:hypothetical protein
MTMPPVSIIIPVYNSGKWIGRCIDSLIDQTHSNWEAIVVIAPSTDNSLLQLKEYYDKRIVIIEEEKKSNCATARNRGINISKGNYITFLDADDWMEPDGITAQVQYLETHRDMQWCCGCIRIVSANDPYTILQPSKDTLQWILSAMFRMKCFDTLRFDTTLPFFDDVDVSLRIGRFPHGHIPVITSNYFLNPSGLTQTTNHLNSELTMWRILIRNRAWEHFPREIKETCVLFLNWLLQTDLVKWKKEHFNES